MAATAVVRERRDAAEATASRQAARHAAETLTAVLEAHDYAGWDPYDALSSPLLKRAAATPLLRRVAIQSLKRAPLNARPLLGVRQHNHTKAAALLTSAFALLRRTDAMARARDLVLEAELPGGGWGYDFDVQTRWGYYRAGQPNAVVTAFAAHALIDSLDVEPTDRAADAVDRARAYALDALLTPDGYFAYFAGSQTPIHNANVLVASVFARTGAVDDAREAVAYTVARQRDDGTWPYGERNGLEWVDGFHTAYVLERLAEWYLHDPGPTLRETIERGTAVYIDRLFERDGTPRATTSSLYPIDIHSASSGISALVQLDAFDDRADATAERVLAWTLANMRRSDGRFAFQRHRHWTNRVPYIRWSDAHMLLALARFTQGVA